MTHPRTTRMAALVLAAGMAAATPASLRGQTPMSPYEQLQVFSGVLSQIRVNYVDSVNLGGLVRAAIEGMLEGLDPHSRYVSRQDFDLRNAFERGELAGTGVSLEDADGAVIVLGVDPSGPAERAGVQPGDRIRALDGFPVAGLDASALEVRLLGDKASRVRLTLERGPLVDPDTFAVTLRREIIEARFVSPARLAAPGIGYVRLSRFTPTAPEELKAALKKAKGMGAARLILDLRGNPGGSMTALSEIASLFLPAGVELFHTEGRTRGARDTVRTAGAGEYAALPLVVLVDGGSASAAEMLAGTLQDLDRAVIVGRRTFGKALMQTALPLPGGDVVWLTTARIASPSGRVIQRSYVQTGSRRFGAVAGVANPAADSVKVFRTRNGRTVRGGGGIEPDVVREGAELPAWFAIAADSGFILAIADSVGRALPLAKDAMPAWAADTAAWDSRLVTPFLARVHAWLGARADASAPLRRRLGRILAHRAAEVRWGAETAEEFTLAVDPDVGLAVETVPRIERLLMALP
jgi:carboxyl-terminal processing protease